jgi:hypothetical protein
VAAPADTPPEESPAPEAAPAEPAPELDAGEEPPVPSPGPEPPTLPAPEPPLAVDDRATVYEGESVFVDVLANDTPTYGLTLRSASGDARGRLTVFGRGIVYEAPLGFRGEDSFTYEISNTSGVVSTGAVSVAVLPVNRAPAFVPGGDVTVREDEAWNGVPWATDVSAGAGDDHQSLRFEVVSSNPSLFAAGPAIGAQGDLSFAPTRDVHGHADVDVTALDDGGTEHGGVDTSATRRFTIEVLPVNDPPRFATGGDIAVLRDAGPQARPWITSASAGPADESGQKVVLSASDDNPALFTPAGRPAIDPAGVLTFTTAPRAVGTATVTVRAHDDGGTADGGDDTTLHTFAVTVLPVNDAPVLTGAGDQTVVEDAPAQNVAWASQLATGPAADEAGQELMVTTVNDDNALFATQPSVSPTGLLTYRPAADTSGVATVTVTARDDGGTANGGQDTTVASFRITVLPANDAPVVSGGTDQTVAEDDPARSVAWASLSPGPADEAAQMLSVATSNDANALFAVQPAVNASGVLTYRPAADTSGTATVTVAVSDDGGSANGGADTTVRTFTITVGSVNDAPRIIGGANHTVLEDAGLQSLPWAAFAAGPPDESTQTLSVVTSNDDSALFTVQPSLSAGGILSYRPAPDASGSANVTVTVADDGGTAGGGVDTTVRVFTITVVPVNDEPVVTGGASQTVDEDAGAQSLAWASFATGPADEAGQAPTVTTSNDANALFAVQPSVSPAGVLSYRPAADAHGSANVTVTVADDGGTANGGADTTVRTFAITVLPVNDAPVLTGGGNQTVLEDAGAQSVAWSALAAGPADESGQVLSVSTSNDANALFAVQPAVNAGGVLSYRPAPDASGSATVTVTVSDDGGTADGGVDTTVRTFTIAVLAVNDAPTLAPAAAQTVAEGDGPQSVMLTAATPGPAAESSQVVTLTTTVDHPEYFDAADPPSVAADGTLTYTPAATQFGVATVTVTATDDGGTANGGADSASITFTISVTALPPLAGEDSYNTTVGAALHVGAPGVLANDADVNTTSLSVTPGTFPTANGSVTIGSDGSFDYQPSVLFLGGTDSFTYELVGSGGQTATGTVTVSVSLLAPTTQTLYLGSSGLSAEVWDLTAAPPAAGPVPDWDGDGDPGLTIVGSDGEETVTDPKKQHFWTYETGLSILGLHGPLTLHLTAASKDFHTDKPETVWVYVYDCPGGLAVASTSACTKIGSNAVLVTKWNVTPTWASHDVVVPLDATLLVGRQLRLRVLVHGEKLWFPLVSPTASSSVFTQ